jgi:hypothetical protein
MTNRNRSGYRSPAQLGLQALNVGISPRTFAMFTLATARAGITKRAAVEKLLEDFAKQHGIKPSDVEPKPNRRPSRNELVLLTR